jgi:hypothetical protein
MGQLKPTLIDIDTDLWREVKIEALKKGVTAQDWLNDLIRRTLQEIKS